jgi:hypothetical protein
VVYSIFYVKVQVCYLITIFFYQAGQESYRFTNQLALFVSYLFLTSTMLLRLQYTSVKSIMITTTVMAAVKVHDFETTTYNLHANLHGLNCPVRSQTHINVPSCPRIVIQIHKRLA